MPGEVRQRTKARRAGSWEGCGQPYPDCPDESLAAAGKRMPGHAADGALMSSSARLRQQIIR